MGKFVTRIVLAGTGGLFFTIFFCGVISSVAPVADLAGALADLPPAAAQAALRPEEEHLVKLFEKASRSVVFITNAAVKRSFFFNTSR
ncbi:MAG: hypothetical protein VX387_10730, partial [Planctomycetota bacterium]|nr:hypothetical protein [Planctomycetota bacterium]